MSLHINELGGNCHFVSVTGDDYLSDKVKNYLNEKILRLIYSKTNLDLLLTKKIYG